MSLFTFDYQVRGRRVVDGTLWRSPGGQNRPGLLAGTGTAWHHDSALGSSATSTELAPLPEPAELRPPPEHADKQWHWLMMSGDEKPRVVEWVAGDDRWAMAGCWLALSPVDMAMGDTRYLGPVEWREPQSVGGWVSGNAARVVELEAEVARLTQERDNWKWSNEARAQLTSDAVDHAANVTEKLRRLRAGLEALMHLAPISICRLLEGREL